MKNAYSAAFCLLALAACSNPSKPSAENFTAGMNAYMAKRGDFCLAKTVWPIDVTQNEMDAHGRNALQMPVLEKVGLVTSSIATVDVKDDDTNAGTKIKVLRYNLTDEGKKYYLTKSMDRKKADGSLTHVPGDFCAAKLTLDKVVGWEPPKKSDGGDITTVTYTYNVDPAPWTLNADVQKVFPVVAYIVNGAKKVQLKETFVLTSSGWKAVDL